MIVWDYYLQEKYIHWLLLYQFVGTVKYSAISFVFQALVRSNDAKATTGSN